jgi:hypothetical protein|tara:strand:+ start:1720 stop:2061 length:342 start_codon:yes stop_codon:yes gene_type:complete
MGAIINASMRVDKLPKEKFVKGKDGAVYYNFTISINDETRYGNNVGLMDSRSQEEREAKKPNVYFGNGKVVWVKDVTHGGGRIMVAEKENEKEELAKFRPAKAEVEGSDDLPF